VVYEFFTFSPLYVKLTGVMFESVEICLGGVQFLNSGFEC